MINTLEIEKKSLAEDYKYWNSYIAETNMGNLGKSIRLKNIESRIKEIANLPYAYMLDEASISRIYRHISGDSSSNSWGTISAQRYNLSDKENKERTEQLKADIRKMGLGFVPLEGGWRECQDSSVPYDQCPEDKLVTSVERSFFVPGVSKEQISQLRDKYEQDAVIYGDKGTGGTAQLIQNDGQVFNLGNFSQETAADILAQGYSKMKNGSRYVFRGTSGDDPRKVKRGGSFSAMSTGKSRADRETTTQAIKSMYNDTILNPETQRNIKIKSALSYGKNHPSYIAAMQHIRSKLNKNI